MKLKKLAALLLSLVMILSNTIVAFAANGPNRYLGYIELYDIYDIDIFLYNNFTSDPVGTIKGATYNTSTNTLTLDNFNHPELCISTNTMGDDFKIKLIGNSHIQQLAVWGDMHGGSCEFTGSGKLYINENKVVTEAILFVPEGASSVIKASDSTTITAYAPENGRTLRINGTDNKKSIVGNASKAPTIENCYTQTTVPVITAIDPYESEYEVYTKQGSDGKFTIKTEKWTNATYYRIYQMVKNPEDDSYLLCYYLRVEGDFDPATYGLTATNETISAHTTSYSSAEVLWNDANDKQYIFSWEWDSETSSSYYQKYSVKRFVKVDDYYTGGEAQWYFATKSDDTTKYADSFSDPENYGYTKEKLIIDGLYILSVTASPYTLSGGNHTHSYKNVVTKATTTKNGKIVPTCSCGATKAATAIYYPKTITLSATKYTYDGKVKKPTVKVVGSNGKAIAASNYTVSYASGCKNIGKYTVKITFKGNYSGTVTKTFNINPKGTSLSSVSAGKKCFTAKWKKQATQTTGYQIQYATDSKFTKGVKTVTVKKNSTTSTKVSKLTAKKKYYVRIRTYKTVSKVNYYSGWSGAKTVTTKK